MFLKSSSLRVGFSLLVIATVAVGALSVRLLRHEGERLAHESLRALRERAQILADDLRLAVEGVETELLAQLAALRAKEAHGTLKQWPETHPLVRNTFIWNPTGRRLEWPDPDGLITQEGRSFITRYEPLFAERLEALLHSVGAEGEGRGDAQQGASPRVKLQQEVRQRAAGNVEGVATGRSGWIPWFEGDQLYLLGWQERDGRVMGVEIEMAALLSRAMLALPREQQPDRAWALLDGTSRVVYQSGALEVRAGMTPLLAVGLGATLPHWQIALYGAEASLAGRGRGARLASGLLVALLLIAILTGGGLLLWEAGRRAREARQKTTFVSNVSHELKTPLTTLRLYAELLREGRVVGEEKQQHYFDVMIGECARLGRLVNNMLDFSRLEQQRRVYTVEPLDVAAWLETFLEAQRVRLREAGLALEAPPAGGAMCVRTDRDALEQVVLNLFDNAIKYAAAGGVVEVAVTARDEDVWLDVMDRGPGVADALREKVFENFYRIDATLTARVPGSGLGLSIARRLLRDLGGDLLCLPREGGGACFRIVLRRS